MEMRHFEKMRVTASLLGFGCMRFPLTEDHRIDEVKSKALINRALEGGVNYIDTAYPYHDQESEGFVGKALADVPRESYLLATKLPVWLVKETEDVRKYFEEQLQRLQTDYVDFYLLHALNKERWEAILRLGMIEVLEELRAEGRIRHIGFSFHDEYPVFKDILLHRGWDFCQIQLNYVDTEIQQGIKGYELAASQGVPVVIMEPVKGGALAKLPEIMEKPLKNENLNASIASWAFRYVGSLLNVKVVLSGMTEMDQLEDNLKTFTDFEPLTPKEAAAVEEVKALYKSRQKNDCTTCGYCMPCPFGVNIPKNFKIWNTGSIYEDLEGAKADYQDLPEERRAPICTECGACEPQCPQGIPIIADLKRVAEELA